MAVSDDGALMATACLDGTLRMWETQFFSKIMQFEMPNIACACMAMSPSGQTCTVSAADPLHVYQLDIAVSDRCSST